MEKRNYKNGLIEFMRFVFSVVIVFHHARYLGGGSKYALFAGKGYIGVEFFFVVSGFLMAQSAAKRMDDTCVGLGEETVKFVFRKIKSILPYYIPAVIASCIWLVYSQKPHIGEISIWIWDICFLGMSGIKTASVVGASWYLSAMFLSMLLLYPLLRRYKGQFLLIIAPLVSIFTLGYLSKTYGDLNLYSNSYQVVYVGMLRAIAEICLGCVCWKLTDFLKQTKVSAFIKALIGFATILGFLFVLYLAQYGKKPGIDFVMLLVIAVCVTLTFWQCDWAFMRCGIFSVLGKLSIALYLNHRWVQSVLRTVLPVSLGYRNMLIIFIASSIAVSLLQMGLYLLVKKLWQNQKSSLKQC